MNFKKVSAILFSFLMLSGVLVLIQYIPVSSASAPSASISNSLYINGTLSGYETGSNGPIITVTVPGVYTHEKVSVSTPTSTVWTSTSSSSTHTFSLGTLGYLSGTVTIKNFAFEMPPSQSQGIWTLGTVTATLEANGNQYTYSQTVDASFTNAYYVIAPSFSTSLTGSYSSSLVISLTPNSGSLFESGAAGGETTTASTGLQSSYPSQSSVPFDTYYQYPGGSSSDITVTPPSGTSSYSISFTAPELMVIESDVPDEDCLPIV